MTRLTRYVTAAALTAGGMFASVAASSAMPMVTTTQPASRLVEHVAWYCGPGWHPDYWGRCVPNRVIVYPGYYYGWGWHRPAFHAWHRPAWHRWHRW